MTVFGGAGGGGGGGEKKGGGGGGGGHDVLLFSLGYSAGASAKERGSAMHRFHSIKFILIGGIPRNW